MDVHRPSRTGNSRFEGKVINVRRAVAIQCTLYNVQGYACRAARLLSTFPSDRAARPEVPRQGYAGQELPLRDEPGQTARFLIRLTLRLQLINFKSLAWSRPKEFLSLSIQIVDVLAQPTDSH